VETRAGWGGRRVEGKESVCEYRDMGNGPIFNKNISLPSLPPSLPSFVFKRTLFLQRGQLALQLLDSPFVFLHVIAQGLSFLIAVLELTVEEQGGFQELREGRREGG